MCQRETEVIDGKIIGIMWKWCCLHYCDGIMFTLLKWNNVASYFIESLENWDMTYLYKIL